MNHIPIRKQAIDRSGVNIATVQNAQIGIVSHLALPSSISYFYFETCKLSELYADREDSRQLVVPDYEEASKNLAEKIKELLFPSYENYSLTVQEALSELF